MFNEYKNVMGYILDEIEAMCNRLNWDEIDLWCDCYECGDVQEIVLGLVPSAYHDLALEELRNAYHKCCYTLDMIDECWDCH